MQSAQLLLQAYTAQALLTPHIEFLALPLRHKQRNEQAAAHSLERSKKKKVLLAAKIIC